MKGTVITIIGCLVILLGISLYCGLTNRWESERYILAVEEVQAFLTQGDWENAERSITDAHANWEKTAEVLYLWVGHDDIDDVNLGFGLLDVAIQEKDSVYARLYAEQLVQALAHIYHRDALALKNVF